MGDVAEAEADLQALVAHGQVRWTAIPIKRARHKGFAGRSIRHGGMTVSIIGQPFAEIYDGYERKSLMILRPS